MRSDTPTQCGTILVADDNVEIRALAKALLEHAGYSVATAADGSEAWHYYEQNQSNTVLLLTDVVMPNMNGFDLADRILGLDSHLPVVFMSGDAWGPHRGLECLTKPFGSAELLETVNRALASSSKKVTA